MTGLHELLAVPAPSSDELVAYCSEQSAAGWPDGPVIAAGLSDAVGRRWPADDLRAIADYAKTRASQAATTIPPLYAEAVLRAARGETDLLLGLPHEYHQTWSVSLLALLTADEQEH